MDQLQLFFENKPQHDVVEAFFTSTLQEMAVLALFSGEGNVDGYKQAHELIEEVFQRLKQAYGKKPPTSNTSPR